MRRLAARDLDPALLARRAERPRLEEPAARHEEAADGGRNGDGEAQRRADAQDWTVVRDVQGTETVLEGVIVDDHFVGVSALSAKGAESTITFAGLPPRR